MADLHCCKSLDNFPSDVIAMIDRYSTFQLSQDSSELLWETPIYEDNEDEDYDEDYLFCQRWAINSRDIFTTTKSDTVSVFIDQKFYSKIQKENILSVCIGRSDKIIRPSASAYYIIVLHGLTISIYNIYGQCVYEFQISDPFKNTSVYGYGSICGIFTSGDEIIVREFQYHSNNINNDPKDNNYNKVILQVYNWFGIKLRSFEILNHSEQFRAPDRICFDISVDGTGIRFIYTTTTKKTFFGTKTYLCRHDMHGVLLDQIPIHDSMEICSVPTRFGQVISAELHKNGLVNITLHDFNDKGKMRTLVSTEYCFSRMTVDCNGTILLMDSDSIRCFGRRVES